MLRLQQEIPIIMFIHFNFFYSLPSNSPCERHTFNPLLFNQVCISRRPFRGRGASLRDRAHLNRHPHNTPWLREPHGSMRQIKHVISILVMSSPWRDNHHTTGYAQPPAHNSINTYPYNATGYKHTFKMIRVFFSQAAGAHPIVCLYLTQPKSITQWTRLHSWLPWFQLR